MLDRYLERRYNYSELCTRAISFRGQACQRKKEKLKNGDGPWHGRRAPMNEPGLRGERKKFG
jgi:hypothetical protein